MNIISRIYHKCCSTLYHCRFKNVSKTSFIDHRTIVKNKNNLIMGDHTNIYAGSEILNSRAKFIMKEGAGSAVGLLVVTGNHMVVKGMAFHDITNEVKDRLDPNHMMDRDVVVEENVWLGSHVTLLSGVTIGRGASVGSGAVVRSSIPPYAIVIGNPAKVVGFNFTPEEIIEHEQVLYPEDKRLTLELLEKNYNKFFLKRLKEIKEFTRP